MYNKNPNFISLFLDPNKKARLLLPHTEKRQTYPRHFTICFHIEYQNRSHESLLIGWVKCDVTIAISFLWFFFLKKLGIFMTENKTIKFFVIFSTKCKFTSIKVEAINSRWKFLFLFFGGGGFKRIYSYLLIVAQIWHKVARIEHPIRIELTTQF